MKKLTLFALVFWVFQSLASACSAADNAAPRQVVQDFYSWYIKKQDTLAFPVLDSEIYNYVSRGTVDKLRKDYYSKKLQDTDYFTKVQDYDSKDWFQNISIGTPSTSKGTTKIQVTFGSSDKISVAAYLTQEGSSWKIFKVETDSAKGR